MAAIADPAADEEVSDHVDHEMGLAACRDPGKDAEDVNR
jgi:hypothetical protein